MSKLHSYKICLPQFCGGISKVVLRWNM